jgi:flagellar hook-associated protein 3 FlgL
MRISTEQMFTKGLNQINDINEQLQKTQLQISTGKKVLAPADDPVASTRITEVNQDLSMSKQYQANINLVQSNLKFEDGLLSNVDNVIQRIRELSVNAGNGTLSKSDLSSISLEVKQRLEQLAGMLNTTNASGEHVFGGFQGSQAPFVKDNSGKYVYQGDEGRRTIQIDDSVSIASTENGQAIFEDVPSAKNTFFTQASPTNTAIPPAQISTGQVIDQATYDKFVPEDLTIKFNPITNVTPSQANYTISESSTGKVLLSNIPYVPNQPIQVKGIQFDITGNPAPGDQFSVQSSQKQGLLTTVEKMIYTLDNFTPTTEGRNVLKTNLTDNLTNLDNAETSLLEARGQIGARLNTLDTTNQQHQDVDVINKDILSKLQDVDYASVISDLSMQQFGLQAAYSSYSKITKLSLFDHL